MRVLYVEDTLELAAAFLRLVERRVPGLDITHVSDGDQALALIEAESWGAVVTDFKLYKEDIGMTNGGHIARAAIEKSIPVRILSTGYPTTEFEEIWLRKPNGAHVVFAWLHALKHDLPVPPMPKVV